MFDRNDAIVEGTSVPVRMGDHTGDVTLDDADYGDFGDFGEDYVEYARSAGTCCRHLNRVRRHTTRTSAPLDFDD